MPEGKLETGAPPLGAALGFRVSDAGRCPAVSRLGYRLFIGTKSLVS